MGKKQIIGEKIGIEEVANLLPGYSPIPETPLPAILCAFAPVVGTRLLVRLSGYGAAASVMFAYVVRDGVNHILQGGDGGGANFFRMLTLDKPIMLRDGDVVVITDIGLFPAAVTGSAWWADVSV